MSKHHRKNNGEERFMAIGYPMFEHIANKVRANCPDAWVINYTNPMTVCIRTLYKTFPEIKAFGCCHEVFGTQRLLCDMLDIHLSFCAIHFLCPTIS